MTRSFIIYFLLFSLVVIQADLQIKGPNRALENTKIKYKVIDTDLRKNVTRKTNLSVDSRFARIGRRGFLKVLPLPIQPQKATITASNGKSVDTKTIILKRPSCKSQVRRDVRYISSRKGTFVIFTSLSKHTIEVTLKSNNSRFFTRVIRAKSSISFPVFNNDRSLNITFCKYLD